MSSSPIAAVLDDLADQLPAPDSHRLSFTDSEQRTMVEALAGVPDPRHRRGVRYLFTPLLSAAVCAMLCGTRSFAAIVEWIADLRGPARTNLALTEDARGDDAVAAADRGGSDRAGTSGRDLAEAAAGAPSRP
jgi:hypothetical protein